MPSLNVTRTVRGGSGPESGLSVRAVTLASAPALYRWGPTWQARHHADEPRADEPEMEAAPEGSRGDQAEELSS